LSTTDAASHLTPTTLYSGTHVLEGVVQIAAGTGRSVSRLGFILDQEHACVLLSDGTIRCWGANSQGEVGNGTTVNQASPAAVNSFVANVEPAAALHNSQVALVTALLDCPQDGQARIILTLTQGSVSGTGHAEAECAGYLLSVPITVPSQGPGGWTPGATTAQVEAIIGNGPDGSTDDTHWTRQVVLSFAN
jgi:hypothetical protein